jgi:hypothetical protein
VSIVSYFPTPYMDVHVVLVAHRDQVLHRRTECHTLDPILVGLELRDMTGRPGHVPYLDTGLVPILSDG